MSRNLSSRERGLVVLGGLALVVFLGWTLVLQPGLGEMARLDDSIAKHTRDLAEIRTVAQELTGLKDRLSGFSRKISVREKGFSLAGRVEERVAEADLKKHLSSLQPLPPQKTKDNLTRSAVELKLKDFPLEKVVKLLHNLEYGDQPLGVTRFTLNRTRKGLEASLRVETLIKN